MQCWTGPRSENRLRGGGERLNEGRTGSAQSCGRHRARAAPACPAAGGRREEERELGGMRRRMVRPACFDGAGTKKKDRGRAPQPTHLLLVGKLLSLLDRLIKLLLHGLTVGLGAGAHVRFLRAQGTQPARMRERGRQAAEWRQASGGEDEDPPCLRRARRGRGPRGKSGSCAHRPSL